MERNIDVIKDADGNSIVMINDIRFKGKRSVNWDDVRLYLRNYVGEVERYNVFHASLVVLATGEDDLTSHQLRDTL